MLPGYSVARSISIPVPAFAISLAAAAATFLSPSTHPAAPCYGLAAAARSNDDSATGIALGPDGSVYVTGGFFGVATFGAGSTSLSLTSSAGSSDGFLWKLTPNGSAVWVRGMGGAGADVANSVAVASDGSVYALGSFQGTTSFGAYSLSAIGPTDGFVTKLDANGNYLWAKRMGGIDAIEGTTIGQGIAVAPDGSVYTTGSFQGTANFGSSTLTSVGDSDLFIAKLDPSSGSFLWANRMGGTIGDYLAAVAVAADGSIYVAGSFHGVADFGSNTLDSGGYYRTFISKLSPSGAFLWARGVGGTGWDLPGGVAVAPNGTVYVAGGFCGMADFNPSDTATYFLRSAGQKDVFLLNLTASGDFISAEQMGGPNDDCARDVAVAADGTVYTTGYFQGTANFDPSGSGTYLLQSAGGQDMFVSKFAGSLSVAVNQAPTQADPTTASPIVFRVVFSSPVADFTASDVTLGGTAPGTLVATVAMVGTDGTTYDVSVTGMAGNGTVSAAVGAGKAHDALGRSNTASTSTDAVVTFGVSSGPAISGVTVSEAANPNNGILESNENLTIAWTVTSAAGIASQTLTVNGVGVSPISSLNGNSGYVCAIGTRAGRRHSYTIHVVDAQGVELGQFGHVQCDESGCRTDRVEHRGCRGRHDQERHPRLERPPQDHLGGHQSQRHRFADCDGRWPGDFADQRPLQRPVLLLHHRQLGGRQPLLHRSFGGREGRCLQ